MQHWADYVVFVVFLLASLGIGVFHAVTGGRQQTTQEYIMADRKLKLVPAMLSLLVSHQSAIMILGFTAEMYTQGAQTWPMALLGYSLAVIGAERLVVPWMYPLRLTSVYEYFELRYNSKTLRVFVASLGILNSLLYMGAAMFAPAVALEAAAGFPAYASIPLMATVCVAYTTLGGMKAVVWTDVFQFLVILGGMLGILIKGLLVVGGFSAAFAAAEAEDRLTWIDLSADPTVRHTLWGFLFGWSSNWSFAYALHQPSIQRYTAVTSLVAARLVLLLNIPALFILVSMSCLIGIVVLAYFSLLGCDPLVSGEATNPNQILPVFVKDVFADIHGFSGLFIATLFSGALSSVSSSLSGCAANIWSDILSLKLGHLSDRKATCVNKMIVMVCGAISTGLAFLAALMPGPISQVSLALLGSLAGPLLGIYLVSGVKWFRWVDWKGVMAAAIMATCLNFWISFGSISTKGRHPSLPPVSTQGCVPPINATTSNVTEVEGFSRLYGLSYQWYTPLGLVVTVVFSLLFSAVIYFTCRDENPNVDKDCLFIPFGKIFSFYDTVDETEQENQKRAAAAEEKISLAASPADSTKPTVSDESSNAHFIASDTRL